MLRYNRIPYTVQSTDYIRNGENNMNGLFIFIIFRAVCYTYESSVYKE